MAQDKIYTDNRGGYAELPVFSQADANVEYLRKDALLEWLKKKKSQCMPESMAQVYFQMFVDKLNSM